MEGRLGDELLPPSSSKPGLVMNKAVVWCLRALRAPVAYAPGASQHTGAVRVPAPWEVCRGREPVESCLRREV